MAASDSISGQQFGTVQYYEGHVDPGQLRPRQAGIIGSKVDKLTARMRQHGYAGLPPVETSYTHGEIGISDGHHRHLAAMATGTKVHAIGVSSRGIPPGTSEVSKDRYDELWNTL